MSEKTSIQLTYCFTALNKLLFRLNDAIESYATSDNDINLRNLTKSFALTFYCAWMIITALIGNEVPPRSGPEAVFAKAEELGLIKDSATWLAMLRVRNNLFGTIRTEATLDFADRVCTDYFEALAEFTQSFMT